MRYPEPLKKGGTIGFIAPSFGCAIEPYKTRFENAIRLFDQMGYKIWLGPNCYSDSGIGISNKPSLCGAELNAAMTDSGADSDVIITCGGGELMCEVVPFIDFDAIKKSRPKWYMGYSDNTNYVFLSAVLADTAAIYGPCAPAFGREPWHKSVEDAFKLLSGEIDTVTGYDMWEKEEYDEDSDDLSEKSQAETDPLTPYQVNERTVNQYYLPENNNGTVSGDDFKERIEIKGRLLGGCLDLLSLLVGTKYDRVNEFLEKYRDDGIIWFIESCDLDMLSIRRALWQMREAGWFRYVKGFMFGRPLHFGEEALGVNQYSAVTDILKDLNVPIVMDLDIGHLPPMMPIICGALADVSFTGNMTQIRYDFEDKNNSSEDKIENKSDDIKVFDREKDSVLADFLEHNRKSEAVCYVDGSFDKASGRYACGVILLHNGQLIEISKSFQDEEMKTMWNVAGEIEGSMHAIKYCVDHGIKSLDMYYDYEGIEKWAVGLWKTNKEGTKAYKRFYDEAAKGLTVHFHKVKGHSGNMGNDKADELARAALGI